MREITVEYLEQELAYARHEQSEMIRPDRDDEYYAAAVIATLEDLISYAKGR